MPLVRVQVRNEYALGQPELYREANSEDPKAVLDGVAVAGLVGILRQLGDLADFAAEVFHGLQEQVMSTSSRSHKLKVRLQRIEAALPPLEKAILAQKSHLHFAYTAGTVWHAHFESEQNHFIYNDLPEFITDSYEKSRDPPRLHLLDKFDIGGPGSCLKRYSDPTFFRRASDNFAEANVKKVSKVKKSRRSKKRRTWERNEVLSHGASVSNHSDRTKFASREFDEQIPLQTVSTFAASLKSDLGDQSGSFDSKTGSGYIECVFYPTHSTQPEEHEPEELHFSGLSMPYHGSVDSADNDLPCSLSKEQTGSISLINHHDTVDSASVDDYSGVVYNDSPRSLSKEQTDPCSLINHHDTDDSTSVDENVVVIGTESSHSSSGDPSGPNSCFVTWDEKTEVVEPVGNQYDHAETAEMLIMNIDHHPREKEAVNFRTIDHLDFQLDHEGTTTSVSGRDHLNDIESDPDNFMDAHNTIESESETDLDCHTKLEVEQSPNFNDIGTQDAVNELIAHQLDFQPSNFIPSCSSLCSLTSYDRPNSISSQCYAEEESLQMEEKSPAIGDTLVMDFCENDEILGVSNVEYILRDIPNYGHADYNLETSVSNKVMNTSCESLNSSTEPSGVQPVTIWTNGGLLGLEPSKPPVFSLLNGVSDGSVTGNKDALISPSGQSNNFNGDGDEGKPDQKVHSSESVQPGSSEWSTSCHNDQDVISSQKASWRSSPTDIMVKGNKLGHAQSHPDSIFKDDLEYGTKGTSRVVPETKQAGDPVVKTSTEPSQMDGEIVTQMFGLGSRFLGNGFQKKVSLIHDEKSEPPGFENTADFEHKNNNRSEAYQTFSERNFKAYFESGSLKNSPSSSPPLQHMKISFQPINGFETSKLKLKFPDGSYSHDNSRDVLPSFQLVPEPATQWDDVNSDSDDDTFCRSSRYISDDCLSYHSDSNSEQWESDDTPSSKDEELYDALRRTSLTESILPTVESNKGLGDFLLNFRPQSENIENCVEPGQSGRLHDLPNLSALNLLFELEPEFGSDANDLAELHLPCEPTQLPPPLPPLQWRAMQCHSDVTIDKHDSVSEAHNPAFGLMTLVPSISPQSKPNSEKQWHNTEEAIASSPKSKPECQNLNGQGVNQATNCRGIDEKEDFLHQIKTKSFNLRCTVTEKPTVTSETAANAKVTAILEKANAIRQAVGSDDGEDDDSWSDY